MTQINQHIIRQQKPVAGVKTPPMHSRFNIAFNAIMGQAKAAKVDTHNHAFINFAVHMAEVMAQADQMTADANKIINKRVTR